MRETCMVCIQRYPRAKLELKRGFRLENKHLKDILGELGNSM